jgi:site-specific recombinase XerD
MTSASYLLKFNRKGVDLKPGEKSLVQICVTLNRRKKWISTKIYLEKNQWNAAKGLVQNHPNQIALNANIRDKLAEMQDYELGVLKSKKAFTLEKLSSYLSGDKTEITFTGFMKHEIDTRTDIRPSTRKHHESIQKRIEGFKKIKYFSDLTYQNIEDFDNYLRKDRINQSTIYNIHKRIKSYIARAINNEKMGVEQDPYLRFKCKDGQTNERKFLTWEELLKVQEKDLKIKRLSIVRDLFVFCCYTGLSYSDAWMLNEENIIQNGAEVFLKTFRTKTNEKAMVMLLPKAKEIITKYQGLENGKILPMMTNQRMNGYLKEIAAICEIEKELTTHVARHTFATTVTLLNGVPIETVSKMLGHSSIKTTQIYAKIVDEKIKGDMIKLREKMEKPAIQSTEKP